MTVPAPGSSGSGHTADLLEATHRIDLEVSAWLEELCRVARPLLPWAPGLLSGTGNGVAGRPGLEVTGGGGDVELVELARRTSHTADTRNIEVMMSRGGRAYTIREAYAAMDRTAVHDVLDERRWQDALMITGLDGDGARLDYVGMTAPSLTPIELSASERDGWNACAAHLAAAWRLRRRLLSGEVAAPCEAVLTPNGGCPHAEGAARDPLARDALSRAVQAIERSRTRERRADGQALLEAWQAVYEGRWTLVEQLESDGRRLVLARVNEPRRVARPELSAREQEIAHLLCLGAAQKAIAYELSLAPSTVAFHVRNIVTKLGARSTADAVRLLSSQLAPPAHGAPGGAAT